MCPGRRFMSHPWCLSLWLLHHLGVKAKMATDVQLAIVKNPSHCISPGSKHSSLEGMIFFSKCGWFQQCLSWTQVWDHQTTPVSWLCVHYDWCWCERCSSSFLCQHQHYCWGCHWCFSLHHQYCLELGYYPPVHALLLYLCLYYDHPYRVCFAILAFTFKFDFLPLQSLVLIDYHTECWIIIMIPLWHCLLIMSSPWGTWPKFPHAKIVHLEKSRALNEK